MELLNLDEIVPEHKRIKIAGQEIEIQSDLPLGTMLELTKHVQDLQQSNTNTESFTKCLNVLHSKVLQGLIPYKEFANYMTVNRLLKLINFVFGINEKGEIETKKNE
jgi:hypothetical protein